jgi:flagellar M-ring protein FliF
VKQLLASLTRRQKITIAVVAVLAITALMTFLRWNHEQDFRPLYSGLAQEDAAAVLVKVRESGTEFRLGDGGSAVLVPSEKVAEMRLQLAAAGVPRSGRIGYELFDKSNFGASDFAEQINYHRALEGELERSVMALAEVEQARVHITFPKDSVFVESRQPAKASVLVKLRPGARLSPQNVSAICQLTASAIEGLQAEAVSVVDVRGNLLSRPHQAASPGDAEPSGAVLEYRQQIERDLLAKINATLEPLLGADKFRAGVSVECDFSSSEQSDETFDPAKSVMATSLRTEDMTGVTQASGVPGTASTLPRPAPRPAPASGGVTRRTENVAYQSSRTVRHVKLPVGTIKHMSVSVLVDHAVRWEGTGPKAKRTVEPPTPEKLKAIRGIVAGIVGLSTDRGDQLVVEALPFEATLAPEQLGPAPGATTKPAPTDNTPPWIRNLLGGRFVVAGIAAGAVLGLGLLILVLKKLRKNKTRAEIQPQLSGLPAKKAIEGGENAKEKMEAQIAEQSATKRKQEIEAMAQLKLSQVTTKKAEVLTKHIAEEAKKDATSMVQVLRNWINEKDRTV